MFDFPVGANTPALKYAYIMRLQGIMTILHNQVGDWHRDGYTQQEWDQLPTKIKTEFPYVSQLPKEGWDNFLRTVFDPTSHENNGRIGQCRKEMQESTFFSVTIEDIL
jgi:hypothetical protein